MSRLKSALETLTRPDTVDEAKKFSDAELKAAAEKALSELHRRGWYVRGPAGEWASGSGLVVSKTTVL